MQAKRAALDGLATGRVEMSSYDTKTVTKRGAVRVDRSQVPENMVELVGIEPTTSSLRTMRSPS